MPWKRRASASRDIGRALNIADLRDIARRRVPGFVFEYVESGAEDEATQRGNREALERLRLVPRTLVDTSHRHLRTTILGGAAPKGVTTPFTCSNVFGATELSSRVPVLTW